MLKVPVSPAYLTGWAPEPLAGKSVEFTPSVGGRRSSRKWQSVVGVEWRSPWKAFACHA